ncbi:hypothetical protein QA601_07185 [Chitinispirillales bacterium ANBcel5]|uniref:hypothetical protein n=1 Tax=Cellulosispirillum alkaliphilum TaxID=3039283 RepID=UPI002A575CB3|nr:hypothetical protein [Chitinispirillales bacterium ANBcel5]
MSCTNSCTTKRVACRRYLDSEECPVKQALICRRKYMDALAAQDEFLESPYCGVMVATYLENANFVKDVCQKIIKDGGEIKEKDIADRLLYETMLSCPSNPAPSGLDGSKLFQDIERFEEFQKGLRDDVESAAAELVSILRSNEFQQDLIENHSDCDGEFDFLTSNEIAEYYPDIAPEDRAEVKIRTIDHYCATLTDYLAVSETGNEFLGDLLDNNKLRDLPAFGTVWGLMTSGKSAIEKNSATAKIVYNAFGRFLQNVVPRVDYEIKQMLQNNMANSVNAVFQRGAVKNILDFLDEKFGGIRVSSWIRERTGSFVQTINANMESRTRDFVAWDNLQSALAEKAYGDFSDLTSDTSFTEAAEVHGHIKTLDSAPVGLALDAFSLFISCVTIATNAKKMDPKDLLSGLNGLLGLLKSTAETFAASCSLKALRTSGNEALKFSKAFKLFKGTARVFGVAAAIVTTVISVLEFNEAYRRNDRQMMGIHAAQIGVGIASVFALVFSLTVITGILIIVGIILAVLAIFLYTPPILNYLESLFWSRTYLDRSPEKRVPIAETTNEFFRTMFTLDVQYEERYDDKDHNQIKVISGVIETGTSIFIGVERIVPEEFHSTPEHVRERENKVQFIAGESNVNGKGSVHFVSNSLNDNHVFIRKLQEIWPFLEGVKDIVNIRVGIDPYATVNDDWKTFALFKMLENEEVDFRQSPVLRSFDSLKLERFFSPYARGSGYTLINNRLQFNFSRQSTVSINVFTRYANELHLRVQMFRMGLVRSTPCAAVIAKVDEHGTNGRTIVNYTLEPPDGRHYDADFKISLMRGREEVHSTTYPRIRVTRDG